MMLRALPFAVVLLGSGVQAADVPSGQDVTLFEALIDEVSGENWLRLRFVAPQIARDGGSVTHAQAEGDMAHLCTTVGLPYAQEYQLDPHTIVVSLMDRMVEFGVQDSGATQFFDAFLVQNNTCIWEAF